MPDWSGESRPGPPRTPEGQAALQDLLDPARLLHARCGRPVAEHPYGSIHLPCPYPPRPPVEFRRVEPDRPPVGTPVRVAFALGCGDPWPGTVVPSARGLAPEQVNVMEHGTGRVVTVRLEQLVHLDADQQVLEQARAILRRHGHGISATCTDACHPPAPAGVPPCPRCSSTRWVSVSLDGGYTRRAQCVPCGHVQSQPIGPGWKAGG